jgi:hypothetical protein
MTKTVQERLRTENPSQALQAEAAQHIDLLESQIAALMAAESGADKVKTDDTQLLDAMASNYWDIKCIDVPTGGGDADVDWIVVEHHMGKKGDVVIAQAHSDDPRRALAEAISSSE